VVGIPPGVEVVLDVDAAVANITINGTLRCNRLASSSLRAMVVLVLGALECGGELAPLAQGVAFTVTLYGRGRQLLVGGGWRSGCACCLRHSRSACC
jgi:hypothetical protein